MTAKTPKDRAIHKLDHTTPGTREAGLGRNLSSVIDGYNAVQADVAAIAAAIAAHPPAGYVAPVLTSNQITPLGS